MLMACMVGFSGTRGTCSETREICFIALGVVLLVVRSMVEEAVFSMLNLAVLTGGVLFEESFPPTSSVFAARGFKGSIFALAVSSCVSHFTGLGLNASIVEFAVLS